MRYTKVILAVLTLASGFALAGCGAGAGFNTPLGGVAVSGSVGTPPPRPYY